MDRGRTTVVNDASPTAPATVLCVEAERALPATRSAVAAHPGVAVVTATSLAAAETLLAETAVDCVVTGDALPDGDGPAVARAVAAATDGVPCVLFAERVPPAVTTDSLPGVVEFRSKRLRGAYSRLPAVVGDLIDDCPGDAPACPDGGADRRSDRVQ